MVQCCESLLQARKVYEHHQQGEQHFTCEDGRLKSRSGSIFGYLTRDQEDGKRVATGYWYEDPVHGTKDTGKGRLGTEE